MKALQFPMEAPTLISFLVHHEIMLRRHLSSPIASLWLLQSPMTLLAATLSCQRYELWLTVVGLIGPFLWSFLLHFVWIKQSYPGLNIQSGEIGWKSNVTTATGEKFGNAFAAAAPHAHTCVQKFVRATAARLAAPARAKPRCPLRWRHADHNAHGAPGEEAFCG